MTEIIYILLGCAAGVAIVYFAYSPLIKKYARSESDLREELAKTTEQNIAAEREIAVLTERLGRQKDEAEELAKRQRTEFMNLANDILDQKSRQFKESNRESLEILLKPFRDNIEGFRKRIEEVYVHEAQQRFSLKEEIKALNEMNMRISSEANNLTAALKGNSKVQGDWGEIILETILDSSNLIKGVHYTTQQTLKNEDGANLRPDVILSLPEGKQIIIDSKVSLKGFVAYCDSEDVATKSIALKEHIRSVRSHIDELGSKRYQSLVDSPDFVIMFMPNEPAFLLALQNDTALWSDAYNKKVIISSPTNLFALLKIVDDLWKRDNQNKNAMAIANEGANLYDKFVGFAETLTDLGKSITSAGDKYEKAISQLKTGRGNLIGRTEKLRDLGVKASKNLPASLSDYED